MKALRIFGAVLFMLACASCSGGCYAFNDNSTQEASGGKNQIPITLVNWNLQTFFDANKDGCEYSEFQKTSDWNKEKYKQRLERLCSVISSLDADIYVFEELENEGIIYDISNNLTGSGQNWNQKKFWNYSLFVKEEGTAIGIGILSRYPIGEAKTHSMVIRIHKEDQPSVRYILETELSVQNKKIRLFANHWKSKLGGTDKTEIWRDWQESILAKRIHRLLQNNEENQAIAGIIICGDFNRDAADFVCNFKDSPGYIADENNTILRYCDFGFTDYTSAQSMWFSDYGNVLQEGGSYVYDDQWERIDNILTAGNIRLTEAAPCTNGAWALAKGYPASYKLYNGEGYSDHLPVMAKILIL